ncbi:hypothetical protein ACN47E_003420 [Coniothyrium glycines]
MYLLQINDAGDLSLVEFFGHDVPPYAILSHTWGPSREEVSFDDVTSDTYKTKTGYRKIVFCGRQAAIDGLDYFWVDTCCINKSSSAELSEAINSMFAWYRHADSCYAYLSDVHAAEQFLGSRWFDRGWTLQELLAPADVLFFTADWNVIGFKTSLAKQLSAETGIHELALTDGANFNAYSTAEKLCWAHDRETTRLEDEAYCLLGIFDVNMPLIYGEGRRAFVRLQQELVKRSNDASIFAYRGVSLYFQLEDPSTTRGDDQVVTGLFASSPKLFRSENIVTYRVPIFDSRTSRTPMLHKRLSFQLIGHVLKFTAAVMKLPPIRSFVEKLRILNLPNTNFNGLSFTKWTSKKLQERIWEEYDDQWIIAFIDCRRTDAGIFGILLRPGPTPGVYVRHHFPSVISIEQQSLFLEENKLEIDDIFVEADSLKRTNAVPVARLSSFLQLSPEAEHPHFRALNLHAFGYNARLDASYLQYYEHSRHDIPDIAFKNNTASYYSARPTVLACLITKRLATEANNEVCHKEVVVLYDAELPRRRGVIRHVALNESHTLTIRSQMQWSQSDSFLNVQNTKKILLITLRISPSLGNALSR